jgi:hypothetical protein
MVFSVSNRSSNTDRATRCNPSGVRQAKELARQSIPAYGRIFHVGISVPEDGLNLECSENLSESLTCSLRSVGKVYDGHPPQSWSLFFEKGLVCR